MLSPFQGLCSRPLLRGISQIPFSGAVLSSPFQGHFAGPLFKGYALHKIIKRICCPLFRGCALVPFSGVVLSASPIKKSLCSKSFLKNVGLGISFFLSLSGCGWTSWLVGWGPLYSWKRTDFVKSSLCGEVLLSSSGFIDASLCKRTGVLYAWGWKELGLGRNSHCSET